MKEGICMDCDCHADVAEDPRHPGEWICDDCLADRRQDEDGDDAEETPSTETAEMVLAENEAQGHLIGQDLADDLIDAAAWLRAVAGLPNVRPMVKAGGLETLADRLEKAGRAAGSTR